MNFIKKLRCKEDEFLLWIQNNLRNPILNKFFILITRFGDGGVVWIAASLIIIMFTPWKNTGIMALISLLCTVVINNLIIKRIVCRKRPYIDVEKLTLLIEAQRDFSFPSGHTATSFAVAMVFLKTLPYSFGISSIVMAALIGFSRMYIGVHYPSDVICGIISGYVIAEIVLTILM